MLRKWGSIGWSDVLYPFTENVIDGKGKREKREGALPCFPFIYEDINQFNGDPGLMVCQALITSNNPISKYHHIESRHSVCACVVQSVTVRHWPLYTLHSLYSSWSDWDHTDPRGFCKLPPPLAQGCLGIDEVEWVERAFLCLWSSQYACLKITIAYGDNFAASNNSEISWLLPEIFILKRSPLEECLSVTDLQPD